MQVQFNVSGYDLAPSLRKLIEQHFRFAASPFRSSLRTIHVKLSDVEGAGAAKRCEAELHLRNGGAMKIQRQDARGVRGPTRCRTDLPLAPQPTTAAPRQVRGIMWSLTRLRHTTVAAVWARLQAASRFWPTPAWILPRASAFSHRTRAT